MKLTEKCKEAFDKWMLDNLKDFIFIDSPTGELTYDMYNLFYRLPENSKFGVLVDFFDSVGIDIVIDRRNIDLFLPIIYSGSNYKSSLLPDKQTRPEARLKAIEKANEIFNSKI